MAVSRLAFSVLILVILVIGFAIGFLAGYLGRRPLASRPAAPYSGKDGGGGPCPPADPPAVEVRQPPAAIGVNGGDHQQDQHYGGYLHDQDPGSVRDRLMSQLNPDTIKAYLRDLTSAPRLAGTPADHATAVKLRDFWRDQGLDEVKLVPYDVLLSYPDPNVYNRVELYDRRDKLIFTTRTDSNRSGLVPPFNAYSASGSPKSRLVYVNYATVDDFLWLSNKANIDMRGKICIARYGKIGPASKVANTERFGGAGLILYTDPDVVTGSTLPYPHSWWMPGNAAESGTLQSNLGDPLTPGYPSTASAYRQPLEGTTLPSIPVQPVGYDDAMHLLQLMVGPEAPEDWRGHLPVTYRLGPGFYQPDMKVQLKVSTTTSHVTVYNAIGILRGSLEPDRYVVLSSHHDAWAYGAASSGSGTAILMEISRVMGKLKKNGWRPRRTILFCGWAAGEYGQVGSTELVEQYGRLLADRTVAVINLDLAVQGNYTFRGRAMPLLQSLMLNVAQQVLNPDISERSRGRTRLYDTWVDRGLRGKEEISNKKAILDAPDVASDLGAFVSRLGVSALDVGFIPKQHRGRTLYPLYHTQYDTFHMVERFIDRNFTYHLAISQFAAELSRRLAEDVLLPFSVLGYVQVLEDAVRQFDKQYGHILKPRGLTQGLEYIIESISTFRATAEAFSQRLPSINISDPLAVRMINDRVMSLERAFIDPSGIPDMPLARHVVFSAVPHDRPVGGQRRPPSFPGLVDSVAEAARSTINSAAKWAAVRKQLSVVAFFIDTAAAVLRPVDDFF